MEFKNWLETSEVPQEILNLDPHISRIPKFLLTKGLQAVGNRIKKGASEEEVYDVLDVISNYIDKMHGPKLAANFRELANLTFQLGFEQRTGTSRMSSTPQFNRTDKVFKNAGINTFSRQSKPIQ